MAYYLLDTNHLSPLVAEGHELRIRILRQRKFGDSFAISTPAVTETLLGIQMLPRSRQNMIEWSKLSVVFEYIDIDRKVAEHAATLQTELRRQGWQLNTVDALIATSALLSDYILLTTDRDFRRVPGLSIENWLSIPGNRRE